MGNLVELLENKGILIYVMELENNAFSGMNGSVNGRPYIIVNGRMSTERIRSTIAHELAHFIFKWPDDMEEKQIEKMATAISGAFLFPVPDAKRELGIRRTAITKDMILTCKEYGISMYLLVKRANLCGIVNDNVTKNFLYSSLVRRDGRSMSQLVSGKKNQVYLCSWYSVQSVRVRYPYRKVRNY